MKIERDKNGNMYGVYPKSSDQGFIDFTEKIKELDWEQRRYEISKDILAAFMSNSDKGVFAGSEEKQARDAVKYADALIAELKMRK